MPGRQPHALKEVSWPKRILTTGRAIHEYRASPETGFGYKELTSHQAKYTIEAFHYAF